MGFGVGMGNDIAHDSNGIRPGRMDGGRAFEGDAADCDQRERTDFCAPVSNPGETLRREPHGFEARLENRPERHIVGSDSQRGCQLLLIVGG